MSSLARFIRMPARCLVLAAIGVWLTTWGIAIEAQVGEQTLSRPSAWPASPPTGMDWPEAQRATWTASALGPLGMGGLELSESWGNHDGSHQGRFKQWTGRAGWPMHAMSWRLNRRGTPSIARDELHFERERSITAGLPVGVHLFRPWGTDEKWLSLRLPVRPKPIGFAVNTLVFAIPLWLLARLLRAGRLRPTWRSVLLTAITGATASIAIALACWVVWLAQGRPELDPPDLNQHWPAARLPTGSANWPVPVPKTFPEEPAWIGWEGNRFGVRGYEYTATSVASGAASWFFVFWSFDAFDDERRVHILRCGWPLPVLVSAEVIEKKEYGWPDTPPPEPAIALPRRIAPVGLAISTVMYGAAAWCLWMIPIAAKRARRRRHGRCLQCGYDVAGLSVCSECGAAREPHSPRD